MSSKLKRHEPWIYACNLSENQVIPIASFWPAIIKWKALSHVQLFVTHGLHSPWNSPGQNTGVSSLSLLQGIFPIQGSNPDLLHYRQILYQLSHKGSSIILEWVAYPFSRGSSQPRNLTGVSCIAGGFFTNRAISSVQFSSVQSLSRVQLFVTPWTAAHQASLSITNSQSPPKPMSIESVMPSNHLILCDPLLFLSSIFPIIRVFSDKPALCIRWPKYWSFSISPFNEH